MLIKGRPKLLIEARPTNYSTTGTPYPKPLACRRHHRWHKLQLLSYMFQATAIDCWLLLLHKELHEEWKKAYCKGISENFPFAVGIYFRK